MSTIIRVLLLALLVISPWFFGGVWAQVQWAMMLLAAVMLAADLLARFSGEDRPNLLPTAWLPLLAGIILGIFQLVPLSSKLQDQLAPTAQTWRAELTAESSGPPFPFSLPDDPKPSVESAENGRAATAREQPNPAEPNRATPEVRKRPGSDSDRDPGQMATTQVAQTKETGTSGRRTLYTVATRENLALLTLATGIFVLASIHMVDKRSMLWFFVALGTCGALLSFFGLVQRLSWNDKFYWFFDPASGGAHSFGPFVNRNNAGGFLNLCLAAGMGLLVWMHGDRSTSRWGRPRREDRPGRRGRSRRRSSGATYSRSRQPTDLGRGTDDWVTDEFESRDTVIDAVAASRQPANKTVGEPRQTTGDANSPAKEHRTPGSAYDDAPEVKQRSGEGKVRDSVDELAAAFRREQASAHRQTTSDGPASPVHGEERSVEHEASPRRSRSQHPRKKPASERTTTSSGRSRRKRNTDTRFGDATYPTSYGVTGAGGFTAMIASVSEFLASLNATRLGAFAIVIFTAGGVLCTASRGSILAMFVAAMLTIGALALQRGQRIYAAGLLCLLAAGVGLMSWAGQTEFVQGRFEQLLDESRLEKGRLPHWRESIQIAPSFWGWGTGLGTYRYVYQRFQERNFNNIVFMYAENQYLQSLIEGGVLALGLLLLMIILTGLAIARLYRTDSPTNRALAVMGTFGLASQAIGGFFDFGLYIPSNMVLMAALCGLVIGRAALLTVWPADVLDAIDESETQGAFYQSPAEVPAEVEGAASLKDDRFTLSGTAQQRRELAVRRRGFRPSRSWLFGLSVPSLLATFLVGFLLLGCLFGSLEMSKASRIENAIRLVPAAELANVTQMRPLSVATAELRAALPHRWDDGEAHLHLAQLLMQQYRVTTYQRLLAATGDTSQPDSETGEDDDPPLDPERWARASVLHWHQAVRQLEAAGRDVQARQLRNNPAVNEYLVRARRHVQLAREMVPTMSEVHYLLAALAPLAADDNPGSVSLSEERISLNRAYHLAPSDATMLFAAGQLELNSGRKQRAFRVWRRSLELTSRHLNRIMRACVGRVTIRDQIFSVLPPRADMMLRVAETLYGGEKFKRQRRAVLLVAERTLEEHPLPLEPAISAYVAARIKTLLGKTEEAVAFLREAVEHDPSQQRWRYQLAQTLLKLGELDEAKEHAIALMNSTEDNQRYKNLATRINEQQVRQQSEAAN